MQNLLERLFLFRVGEHYGAKLGPVQVSFRGINPVAKSGVIQIPHLRVTIRQFPRRLVRIEKHRPRQEPA